MILRGNTSIPYALIVGSLMCVYTKLDIAFVVGVSRC